MEVKIFVYKDLKELLDKYNCQGLLGLAVENLLIKPYHYVMRLIPNEGDFDYSQAEPITVYMDKEYAIAWENTPKQIKDFLLSAIDEELKTLVYSYVYIVQNYERR
jgi:hypothetical protein